MKTVEGIVEHGDARGRELGFPTANISVSDEGVEDGVWVAMVRCEWDEWVPAAVSIGHRSTFYSHGQRLLEAHLLDFQGDLYGTLIQVQLVSRIRPQRRYSTAGLLIDQLHHDVRTTREWAAAYFAGTRSALDCDAGQKVVA